MARTETKKDAGREGEKIKKLSIRMKKIWKKPEL